jgi:hypothetical protein
MLNKEAVRGEPSEDRGLGVGGAFDLNEDFGLGVGGGFEPNGMFGLEAAGMVIDV